MCDLSFCLRWKFSFLGKRSKRKRSNLAFVSAMSSETLTTTSEVEFYSFGEALHETRYLGSSKFLVLLLMKLIASC